MAEIEKTPTLGLNKPPKGYFDWDVPLNENWDKLDFLGAGQLPLLTPMMFDHRLEGDEALGWAMQGSILDGDEYTSVWEKLKTARDRAVQQTLTIRSVTYTFYKDPTSGWVFLDQANYNKAFTNLKDSFGFVLTDVDGKKTITLPKREVFFKPSMNDVNAFGTESLPNITGSYTAWQSLDCNKDNGIAKGTGAISISSPTSVKGCTQWGSGTGVKSWYLDASRSSSAYKNGAKVNPERTTVFIYYKVGNTIVNKEQIDLGNMTTQVDNLATNKANKDLSNVSSNIDYVIESQIKADGSWYRKYKSGWLEQGGIKSISINTINLLKPYSNTNYKVLPSQEDTNYALNMIITAKTTTSFILKARTTKGQDYLTFKGSWVAIGQGA